ncbi:MAG: SAM-dependent methyltransferase, partial [Candidatus Saccharibacteria bacterium]|nr:SAM-dependent methyltransferase [Moraxellaceae bacterium]
KDQGQHQVNAAVGELLTRESKAGVMTEAYYADFQQRANRVKHDLIDFLIKAKREGKKVMAYGAAAKGNTLLNYAGIRPDLLLSVVDRNPAKQNKYLPGSRIPIVEESIIRQEKPDYVLILPWNLRQEVTEQLKYIYEWGGKFVTSVPSLIIN